MNQARLSTTARLAEHDQQDALRIVAAATTIAAIPGMVSVAAREAAATRLREMAHQHPRSAATLAAIVQHLESYQ